MGTTKSKTTNSESIKKINAETLIDAIKKAVSTNSEQIAATDIIKLAHLSSPLILSGKEHLRIKRLVNWLKDSLKLPANSVQTYFGSELSTERSLTPIIESLNSFSLFSKFQLIVIYNADDLKANISKSLITPLQQQNATAFVILTAEAINQKTSLLNELSKSSKVYEIKELDDAKLRDWIVAEVKKSGIKGGITPEAVTVLAASYGNDISALSQEIAKLALMVEPTEKLNHELVIQISGRSPTRQSFELLNQIASKNVINATFLAQELEEQGFHPLQLSAFLSRCFRTMLAFKSAGSSSALGGELANAWFLRNLQQALKAFSLEELKHALGHIKDFDFKLKSLSLPDEINLSILIRNLTTRKI